MNKIRYSYATKYSGERIQDDVSLEACEKTTEIFFSGETEKATIVTHDADLMCKLLEADFFELREIEIRGKRPKTVVSLSGCIPIRALQIRKPRNGNLSKVVMT